jgi:predicted phosphatase
VRATVTIPRGHHDSTVVVSYATLSEDRIVTAIDENGRKVRLTRNEREAAKWLARSGVDQRGV